MANAVKSTDEEYRGPIPELTPEGKKVLKEERAEEKAEADPKPSGRRKAPESHDS